MSAEYILSEGNDQVILCERGIRTFERYTRNTLDLTAVPVIKKLTHLPIIVDPSHATGLRDKVSPMARAAIAAGADGLIIEVHTEPDKALSDGPQSLYPEQFEQLMRDLYVIAPVVGKQLDYAYLDKASMIRRSSHEPGSAPVQVGLQRRARLLQPQGLPAVLRDRGASAELRLLPGSLRPGRQRTRRPSGILPVENSLTGSIHENYDLLLEYDLKIVGEITLRIMHNLIGHRKRRPWTAIKRVYSHPQVFQQCREFLEKHPDWDLIACQDTASCVRPGQGEQRPRGGGHRRRRGGQALPAWWC